MYEAKIILDSVNSAGDQLRESGHSSPFEHQAMAAPGIAIFREFYRGWRQFRKVFVDENRTSRTRA